MWNVRLRPASEADAQWVRETIVSCWNADFVVAHNTIYFPHKLPGVIAETADGRRVGLATYIVKGGDCELVTIDSLIEREGVGTRLLDAVVDRARALGCKRVWLITTNDNLDALAFYQKRGFVLKNLFRNAVARAREQKPSIPLVASNGIRIRDEIELEMILE